MKGSRNFWSLANLPRFTNQKSWLAKILVNFENPEHVCVHCHKRGNMKKHKKSERMLISARVILPPPPKTCCQHFVPTKTGFPRIYYERRSSNNFNRLKYHIIQFTIELVVVVFGQKYHSNSCQMSFLVFLRRNFTL